MFEPEVRFPAGHYRVSDTLNLSNISPDVSKGICGERGNSTTWCMFVRTQPDRILIYRDIENCCLKWPLFQSKLTDHLTD